MTGAGTSTTTTTKLSSSSSQGQNTTTPQKADPDSRYLKLLEQVHKDTVLDYLQKNTNKLSPYEMRQALDPEGTSALIEEHLARHVPTIEAIRNVLVVAPLTLTWLSLAIAAAAYQQEVIVYKGHTAPSFFQLWQEGFPDLSFVALGGWHIYLGAPQSHWFTFAAVALADFLILSFLFLLTAIAQFFSVRAYHRSRGACLWLEAKIFSLSQDSIGWSVNPGEKDKPRWAIEVQAALASLNQALESVKRTVTRFEGVISQQGTAVSSMLGNTSNITTTVSQLTGIYQRMEDGSNIIRGLLPRIEDNLSHLSDDQQDTADTWRRMTQELQIATESIASIAAALSNDPHLIRKAQTLHGVPIRSGRRRKGANPIKRAFKTITGWLGRRGAP